MSHPRFAIAPGPAVILVAAAVGAAVSLYNYFTPLTGITGTPGALLVIGSSILLMLDALVLWFWPQRAVFIVFFVLGVLGALGTLAAAWFLHAWGLMVAMVVVLIGLAITLVAPRLFAPKVVS